MQNYSKWRLELGNMISPTNKQAKRNVFSSLQEMSYASDDRVYSTLKYKRTHRVNEPDLRKKIIVGGSSVCATILSILVMAKKQNGLNKFSDIIDINYGLKEVLTISSASIFGGVVSGIIADKKVNKKRKINEGVFQFMNATIPTLLVGGGMKLLEDNVKYKDSKVVKAITTATALIAGMPLAAFVSNLVNDPKDKEPDRKLTLKDSLVNIDDALGALVVAKVPIFGLDKLLPAIFAWCGYRAGQSN